MDHSYLQGKHPSNYTRSFIKVIIIFSPDA